MSIWRKKVFSPAPFASIVYPREDAIFVANFVLMGYGPAALLMAVPTHDQHFEFAHKYAFAAQGGYSAGRRRPPDLGNHERSL